MKKLKIYIRLLLLILFLSGFSGLSAQEYIQTTFTVTGNHVIVKLKSSAPITGQFSNFSVSFRYLDSYGVNFVVTNSNYSPVGLIQTGFDAVNPLYRNYKFGFQNMSSVATFNNVDEYTIFEFDVVGGTGIGTIGLIQDNIDYNWCPNYIFNGFINDYTNYTDPFYGANLANSDFNDGSQDWFFRTENLNIGKFWKSNAASTNWATSSNWSDNLVPTLTENLTILAGANKPIAGAGSVCNKLQIETGATIDVAYNGTLTVNGDLTIADNNSLIVKSTVAGTGSLITNGSVPSGNKVKIERYVSAYTNNTDGWRFISSPVGNTAIGNFVPGGSDDFFRYNEVLDLWENYMVSPFGFTKGMGYLTAYAASATKSFSGTINDADVTFSNLSLTPIALPATPGWHLLGNPFTSAIKWNDGNWALSNVSSTAKVLNGGGTYTDLGANDIIPAMQGFLVQVSSATNAITIPAAARDHSSLNLLNKSTITERLKLTASSIGNNTYVESIVKTDASATNGFDSDFDANFISGLSGAPQLYTHAGNNMLSTNVLPTINNNVVMVPVSFVAGSASNYKLTADGINTFNCSAITLLDLKTNTSHNLMSNPVYNFTASASDNVNRFQLYFNSAVGIGENNQLGSKIYSNNNDIYVNSAEAIKQVSIYNAIGQLIYSANNPQGSFKYSLNGNSTGYYIVKVITDKNVNSEKVFVK